MGRPKKPEYKRRFDELKVGDVIYDVGTTWNYDETFAGFRESKYVVTGRGRNVVEDYDYRTKKMKRIVTNIVRCGRVEFKVDDFDGTHSFFMGEEDRNFAKYHWREIHGGKICDAIKVNFWDVKKKYENINKHIEEVRKIDYEIAKLQKRRKEIEEGLAD